MSLEDNRSKQYHRLQQVMQLVRRAEAGLCRSRSRLFENQQVDADEFAQSLNLANDLSAMLLQSWRNIQTYVEIGDAPE